MSNRVVMLGLDSFDRSVAGEWLADGRLPVLDELIGSSHERVFDDCNRALPGSAWTNMATGVSAGVHGFIHSRELRPNSYEWDRIDSSHVDAVPFYKHLSEAGVKCAVVDLPIDHPLGVSQLRKTEGRRHIVHVVFVPDDCGVHRPARRRPIQAEPAQEPPLLGGLGRTAHQHAPIHRRHMLDGLE